MTKTFDVLIIGAGPAGCACAYMLKDSGLSVALIDKAQFPRDKTCGDALSADVSNQFGWMDSELQEAFGRFAQKHPSNGIRLFAPNHQFLDVSTSPPDSEKQGGFIAKRIDFDNFFLEQVKKLKNVSLFQGEAIKEVQVLDDSISCQSETTRYEAPIAVGADGALSVIKKKLAPERFEKKHHCSGLRQYYKNVEGFNPGNHIELHFYQEALPGYFWIFPLPDNQANVGIGILSSSASKKEKPLKEIFKNIIATHPNIKERFQNAEPIEGIKGFGLPIGSKKRRISGERFLLTGDAASLIDPFSGEGVGNAIRSGRVAAMHITEAFIKQDFLATFNKRYDKEIYRRMWNELKLSRSLQMMLKYPAIFNYVANKATKNQSVQLLINSMLNNIDLKKQLIKPSFYLKLLFNTQKSKQ